jgi:hypothetical protein
MKQARQSVAAVRELSGSDYDSFREAADLVEARLDARLGDMSGIERLVALYGTKPDKPARPMLLFAPRMEEKGTIFDLGRLSSETIDYEGQWADVSFLIGADGKVRDVDVLRESPKMQGDWISPVTAMVAKRRYAPVDVPPGIDGIRRIERYTMAAYSFKSTGSRMDRRAAPRLEMLDLTFDTPAKPAAGSGTAPAPAPTPAE